MSLLLSSPLPPSILPSLCPTLPPSYPPFLLPSLSPTLPLSYPPSLLPSLSPTLPFSYPPFLLLSLPPTSLLLPSLFPPTLPPSLLLSLSPPPPPPFHLWYLSTHVWTPLIIINSWLLILPYSVTKMVLDQVCVVKNSNPLSCNGQDILFLGTGEICVRLL